MGIGFNEIWVEVVLPFGGDLRSLGVDRFGTLYPVVFDRPARPLHPSRVLPGPNHAMALVFAGPISRCLERN